MIQTIFPNLRSRTLTLSNSINLVQQEGPENTFDYFNEMTFIIKRDLIRIFRVQSTNLVQQMGKNTFNYFKEMDFTIKHDIVGILHVCSNVTPMQKNKVNGNYREHISFGR